MFLGHGREDSPLSRLRESVRCAWNVFFMTSIVYSALGQGYTILTGGKILDHVAHISKYGSLRSGLKTADSGGSQEITG